MKILKSRGFWFLFLIPFLGLSYYVGFVESELYESSSIILIKDLKSPTMPTNMITTLLPNANSNMQDSKLIEKYIYSIEMFNKIDRKFKLKEHYMSRDIDFLQRKYSFSTSADFFKLYKKRVIINYDVTSDTLDISFLHTNAKIAKEILEFIILEAEKRLNMFDRDSGDKILKFIKKQEKTNKKILFSSIQELLNYQNRHKTIDPSIDIKSKSKIISKLEQEIIQKELKYSKLKQYMNSSTIEIRSLKAEIKTLKNKLNSIKSSLSGINKNELNKNLFEFERLKSNVEFNKERYRQTLIQLDLAMIQATQNAKNFIIITKPTLSDSYSQPDKLKNIITIFMALFMIYGILSMIYAIIKDHRD